MQHHEDMRNRRSARFALERVSSRWCCRGESVVAGEQSPRSSGIGSLDEAGLPIGAASNRRAIWINTAAINRRIPHPLRSRSASTRRWCYTSSEVVKDAMLSTLMHREPIVSVSLQAKVREVRTAFVGTWQLMRTPRRMLVLSCLVLPSAVSHVWPVLRR
jgi:hypothetical protein